MDAKQCQHLLEKSMTAPGSRRLGLGLHVCCSSLDASQDHETISAPLSLVDLGDPQHLSLVL